MNAEEAYAECERITWEQARNFAYGIRLLPPAKRRALAAVYAYARRIDDIGDGDLPAQDKTEALEAAREQVLALVAKVKDPRHAADSETDPVLVALADAGARFPIPLEAFTELIDGCLADVNQADLQDVRRPALVLPLRRGQHRPPEPGHLRPHATGAAEPSSPTTSASRCSSPTSCATSARTSATTGSTRRKRTWSDSASSFEPSGSPEPFATDAMRARFANLVDLEATGPASGTPQGCACSPRSTAAARPAPARWRAFTDGCSSASRACQVRCSPGACRCPAARRPWSPHRRWPLRPLEVP